MKRYKISIEFMNEKKMWKHSVMNYDVEMMFEYNVVLYVINYIDEFLENSEEGTYLKHVIVYEAENPLNILLNVDN